MRLPRQLRRSSLAGPESGPNRSPVHFSLALLRDVQGVPCHWLTPDHLLRQDRGLTRELRASAHRSGLLWPAPGSGRNNDDANNQACTFFLYQSVAMRRRDLGGLGHRHRQLIGKFADPIMVATLHHYPDDRLRTGCAQQNTAIT